MKHIKSTEQNRLTDETLNHLLNVSTSEIDNNWFCYDDGVTDPQNSHKKNSTK